MADEESKQRTRQLRAAQAEDGVKAMAEYLAHAEAVRDRTARLRALRLAREAAQAAAPAPAPTRPATPARPERTKTVRIKTVRQKPREVTTTAGRATRRRASAAGTSDRLA